MRQTFFDGTVVSYQGHRNDLGRPFDRLTIPEAIRKYHPEYDEALRASHEAVMAHPWRLPKEVTYLFDWIAAMLRALLHPHPKLNFHTG